MDEYSFYKNTVSLLELVKKGNYSFLVNEGWITQKDMDSIIEVVMKLEYATSDEDNHLTISEIGLKALESLRSENESDLLDTIIHTMPTTLETN